MRSISITSGIIYWILPRLISLKNLCQTMISDINDLGLTEVKESTKTHVQKKLAAEFGSLLQFEVLPGNIRVFATTGSFSRLQLAKEVA